MSKLFAVIKRDFEHVRHNVIALIVCMGLAFIPAFYAWFNIAGGWDPYGNTGQVQVALANSDEGVTGQILPFQVNVGERVVQALTGSDKVGYVVTSEEDALQGVRSGKYYAALVIPDDFSSNLLSVLTQAPTHPVLDYYVNEKRNAIASIVTGKVSGSVQNMVDQGFTEAVAQIAAELFSELTGVLDDDTIMTVVSRLDAVLSDSMTVVRRTSDDLGSYKNVVASLRGVIASSSALVGDQSVSLNGANLLADSANGVRQLDDAATTAKNAASEAADAGANAWNDIEAAIDDAFATASGKTDELVAALGRVDEVARARRDDLQTFYDALERLNGEVYSFAADLELPGHAAEADIQYSHTIENDFSDLMSRTSNAIAYVDDLIATGQRTISDIQASKGNAQSSQAELKELAARARSGIDSARQAYTDNFSGSLAGFADSIDAAAIKAADASATLKDEVDKLRKLLGDTDTDLKSLEDTLDTAQNKLDGVIKKMEDVHAKLLTADSSGDLDMVKSILGADATALADFLASPVELEREAMFPVENNGSAMAPYYTTMALWVGGTLMGVLFYVAISEEAVRKTGAKPRHAYFGRLAFFLALGACQSTILLLGDIFVLGVQCANPLLFLITGWVASTVFINIIYSLSTSFGDIGKAIAVLFMVVQVAGSGGTFPVQMLPKAFQVVYPFLPFVHSENAMRAAMFGLYGNDWITEIGILLAFLVPALLLGLLLRKPFVPVNEWIEEKMEETKLM